MTPCWLGVGGYLHTLFQLHWNTYKCWIINASELWVIKENKIFNQTDSFRPRTSTDRRHFLNSPVLICLHITATVSLKEKWTKQKESGSVSSDNISVQYKTIQTNCQRPICTEACNNIVIVFFVLGVIYCSVSNPDLPSKSHFSASKCLKSRYCLPFSSPDWRVHCLAITDELFKVFIIGLDTE